MLMLAFHDPYSRLFNDVVSRKKKLQLAGTGESLLMAAASSGSLKLVEMLFRKGAKADLEDMRGRNALHYGEGRFVCLFCLFCLFSPYL